MFCTTKLVQWLPLSSMKYQTLMVSFCSKLDKKRTTTPEIRVVNAFRQGLDTRYGERSNPSIAAVLQKQASLSKRLSQTSSIEYADNYPYEVSVPEFERLSSRSHTETAV
ncbi:unnamed protein product [Orchesella dallaii]|uniref:Uncharacterized protein n=1 Tax=Orchesella dallaii TaxID=48710 RepID=A0ABP1PYH9_9HEXA